jgi:cytochrome P450
MGKPIELLFDPKDPNLLQDPYPAYRRMREQAPCWKSPVGIWYFTRYRDCFDLFRSPALSYDVTNSASFQQKLSTDADSGHDSSRPARGTDPYLRPILPSTRVCGRS